MRIDLGTIVNSSDQMKEFSNTQMKATVAMYVSSIVDTVMEEVDSFEKRKIDLINELGKEVTSDDGSSEISVTEENMEEFYSRIDKIIKEEVYVCEEKIDINDLVTSDGNQINISPACISKLKWLIEDTK